MHRSDKPMVPRLDLVVCLALSVLSACSRAPDNSSSATGEWVGTITSEGGVTTVVNTAGSRWSGKARLVEETSIGVEAGADAYMFGYLFAVSATDEHIYVTDEQTDMVRRYDHHGVFAGDVGAIGQGPGEYVDPAMVAVAPDGRIIVYDFAAERMQVYGPDREPVESWPVTKVGLAPMRIDASGVLWAPTVEHDWEKDETTFGIQAFGSEGPIGPGYRVTQPDAPEDQLEVGWMPFLPRFSWTLAGSGRVLAGVPDAYRFEVQERGETVLVVEKYWDPVPIDREHREWQRRETVADARRWFDPAWTWNGRGMPTHLPAYAGLIAAISGEMWVVRYGAAERVGDCADPLAESRSAASPAVDGPCWRETYILDAFDPLGRFLGEVEAPPGIVPDPLTMHIDGERVVAVVENELGTYQVKRYRLVRPHPLRGEAAVEDAGLSASPRSGAVPGS